MRLRRPMLMFRLVLIVLSLTVLQSLWKLWKEDANEPVSDGIQNQDNFFLLWTTDISSFGWKQFLCLLSIYQHRPHVQVHIFSDSLAVQNFYNFIKAGFRLQVLPLSVLTVQEGEAGYRWFQRVAEWKKGPYFYSHITDFWRYYVLYKYGGSYVDFDHLVLNPMQELSSAIGLEKCSTCGEEIRNYLHIVAEKSLVKFEGAYNASHVLGHVEDGYYLLAPGVMINFQPHNPIFKQCLENMDRSYDPSLWASVGPNLITSVFKTVQSHLNVCAPAIFYPVQWFEMKQELQRDTPNLLLEKQLQHSAGLHLFGKSTHNIIIPWHNTISQLLQKICAYGISQNLWEHPFCQNT